MHGDIISKAAFPEVVHNSCNTGTRALPDTLYVHMNSRVDISGNALVPVLQVLHVLIYLNYVAT